MSARKDLKRTRPSKSGVASQIAGSRAERQAKAARAVDDAFNAMTTKPTGWLPASTPQERRLWLRQLVRACGDFVASFDAIGPRPLTSKRVNNRARHAVFFEMNAVDAAFRYPWDVVAVRRSVVSMHNAAVTALRRLEIARGRPTDPAREALARAWQVELGSVPTGKGKRSAFERHLAELKSRLESRGKTSTRSR